MRISLRSISAAGLALAATFFCANAAFGQEATSGLNSGDNAWILTSSAIVLMMTIPGLALFYA